MRSRPCLTLDDCRKITAACEAEAKKNKWSVSIAILKMPVLPVQGGVPIMHQGECVGAISVSGVQSHEDEMICSAGIAALD